MVDDPGGTQDLLKSPVPVDSKSPEVVDPQLTGLCLSGGGYRAMLFHVGVLWRLNELGLLSRVNRISSVSGGSITAGVLGLNWGKLAFQNGFATAFGKLVVDPLREFARHTIDISSVITGALLPHVSISDKIARHYADGLFQGATLQALPDAPEFIICSTNVQTGSLMRFSKKRMADWQLGEFQNPDIPLATAVAASSAFPPVLSPADLRLDEGKIQPLPGATLNQPPYTTKLVLTDGGVYDNLGLEPVWKRCGTVLVSDAGQKISPDPSPAEDWPRHMLRILDIIDNQVRSLRKRQLIASYDNQDRKGTYWGIRSDIADYQVASPLNCPHAATLTIASIPTRLAKLEEPDQEKLINWGYAVCDAAIRKHVAPAAPAPAGFPYARGVI